MYVYIPPPLSYQLPKADPKHMVWMSNNADTASNNPDVSANRLKMLMGIPTGETDYKNILKLRKSKYGLGDRRTLNQAIEFTGECCYL